MKRNCTPGASWFQNRACPYFPCHKAADPETFNCLFCYCPLYALGRDCGGNYGYTAGGVKDCSGCLLPHAAGGYDAVLSRFGQLTARMRQMEERK